MVDRPARSEQDVQRTTAVGVAPPERENALARFQAHPDLDSPFKLTISFTHSCNLDCAVCYADCTMTPGPDELTVEQWKVFLQEQHDCGVLSLLFEGGEVFNRYDDLLQLLDWCGPRFFTRLRTNGTLVDATTARRLVDANVAGVMVDFLGANAAIHDEMTGAPGSFDKACAAVKHLLDAGMTTELLMILHSRNKEQVGGFCELANRLDVPQVSILRLYPIGRARRRWSEFALSMDEMTEVIEFCRRRLSRKLPPFINHSWHPQNGNTCWQMAAVNARGDSIGCSYLREFVNFGNIKQKSLTDTWHDPLYRRLRSGAVRDHCAHCEQEHGTRGGCRATAYAFHGDWDAADPFCRVSNGGVDLRVLPEWMLSPQPGSPTEDPA